MYTYIRDSDNRRYYVYENKNDSHKGMFLTQQEAKDFCDFKNTKIDREMKQIIIDFLSCDLDDSIHWIDKKINAINSIKLLQEE